MDELTDLIAQLETKSLALKNEVEAKKQAIAQLESDFANLFAEKTNCETKLAQLAEDLKHKDAHSTMQSQGMDLNDRVDELVREIDECIHHLKQ